MLKIKSVAQTTCLFPLVILNAFLNPVVYGVVPLEMSLVESMFHSLPL